MAILTQRRTTIRDRGAKAELYIDFDDETRMVVNVRVVTKGFDGWQYRIRVNGQETTRSRGGSFVEDGMMMKPPVTPRPNPQGEVTPHEDCFDPDFDVLLVDIEPSQ